MKVLQCFTTCAIGSNKSDIGPTGLSITPLFLTYHFWRKTQSKIRYLSLALENNATFIFHLHCRDRERKRKRVRLLDSQLFNYFVSSVVIFSFNIIKISVFILFGFL